MNILMEAAIWACLLWSTFSFYNAVMAYNVSNRRSFKIEALQGWACLLVATILILVHIT